MSEEQREQKNDAIPPMPEELLTLNELVLLRAVLEARAAQLRAQLHELPHQRPDGWPVQFEFVQGTLIQIVSEVGQVNKRIRVLVEGETEDSKWLI
jgi:hypothetical protein